MFTWYILTQLLGHTRLQPPADHMLTPSLSPEYEVAERDKHIPDVTRDSFAIWTQSLDSNLTKDIKRSSVSQQHSDKLSEFYESRCKFVISTQSFETAHENDSMSLHRDRDTIIPSFWYIPPTGTTICSASMVFVVKSGWLYAAGVLQSPPNSKI